MKKVKKSNKILKVYFQYVLKAKWKYVVVLIAVVLLAFFDGFYPYLSGKIVDQLNLSTSEGAKHLIFILIAMFVFRGIIEQIQFWFNGYIDIIFLEREPRVDYVRKIQSLDYKFHSNKSTGSLISISSRIHGALNRIFNGINVWGLIQVLDVFISAYFIYIVSPLIAGIYLSTFALAAIVGYPLLKWNVKVRKKFVDESDKIGGIISDNMIGFETVKAFGQEEYEIDRLEEGFDKWQKEGLKYVMTFRFFDGAIYLVTLISLSVIILLAFQGVTRGVWTTGTLVTLIGYSIGMIWKAFNIVYKAKDYMKASVDLEKFIDVMETDSKVVERENAKEMGDISKGISFKNVCFTYTESEDGEEREYVLDDVNFDVELDQTVALVGKSGSGKTTLAKLLMRYYDVDKGRIEINGIDIRGLKLKSLRKSIGLVPQDPVMFNETIKYNVSYGNPDASMDDIISATKNASLHKFIETLPKKYDTVVGERGIKLSGGQRQRLAIARVILEDPEIIIFDEATSQLDSENEKAIQEAFKNLTEYKTTIVIAHRLSTVMHADKIVVFDDGKIVETGTHSELMDTDGIYAMLWKLQTAN